MVIYILTGWWFQPLWKTLISWDDDIPNRWKVIKKQNVPNHQPDGDLHIKNCDVPVTRAEKKPRPGRKPGGVAPRVRRR